MNSGEITEIVTHSKIHFRHNYIVAESFSKSLNSFKIAMVKSTKVKVFLRKHGFI